MKLININKYNQNGRYYAIQVLKFRNRILLELAYEESVYATLPSLLVQLGYEPFFELIAGTSKRILSFSILSRDYDAGYHNDNNS